jgi:hypothetical protein
VTTVRVKGGFSYTLTEDDLLWLGRAASGEGGDPRATIWTWISRFTGLRGWRDELQAQGLARLVRSHSQPVNPRWMEGGDFCMPGGRGYGGRYCEPDLLARRAFYSSLAPADFDPAVKAALAQLRKGSLRNPVPRAVDFADRPTSEAFVERNPGARILACLDGNCHIATSESLRWASSFVEIAASSSWKYALGGFAVGALTLSGWLWWRAR